MHIHLWGHTAQPHSASGTDCRPPVRTISLHVVIFLTVLAIIKVDNFSRIYLLVFYLSFIPLAIGWRLTLRFFVKMFRRSGRNLHATVLIGDGDNMVELYHTLNDLTYGYRVLGIFYDEKDSNYPKGFPLKVL